MLNFVISLFRWLSDHDFLGYDCDWESQSIGNSWISLTTEYGFTSSIISFGVTSLSLFGRTLHTWEELAYSED